MWPLELADGIGTIAELVHWLAGGAESGSPGAFDAPEPDPGPAVPEPPPPRLPVTGWDEFAPQAKRF